ncbi:Uncharacterized conserved protein, DUF2267 family [Haladaptatus litoreus]|uniref:Uncharacterized conserved protein, DUF2267 family n=2 Tax=Haladaptatus litoreus TaxID=553468 RepID=A0A1N6Y518_9EURY|nr:Uncharacterized conserved protein, DUF2267 family [Haladaptatus litoreus]
MKPQTATDHTPPQPIPVIRFTHSGHPSHAVSTPLRTYSPQERTSARHSGCKNFDQPSLPDSAIRFLYFPDVLWLGENMDYSQFIGQTQHRLKLDTQGKTVRAIRATLTTLGERLQEGEAKDLAGPLPMEIDWYLERAESGQRFHFDEFVDRVAEREGIERQDALFHAKGVLSLVAEVVPEGEYQQVRQQLPDEYDPLFELVGNEEAFD